MVEEELEFKIVIQNCVASVNLFTTINLVSIFQQLVDAEKMEVRYNPEQFPGLILKIKDPKVSSLVFSSGKLVITGAKSTEMVTEGVTKIIGILRTVGTVVESDPEIIVQNIVASGNFNNLVIDNGFIRFRFKSTINKSNSCFPLILVFSSLNHPVMNGGRSFDAMQIYNLIAACAMQCNLR